MKISDGIEAYKKEYLDDLKTGDKRHKQLCRVLESYSCSDMHSITNKDLTDSLGRWKGSTRNRLKSAITHFWRWGRSHGYCDLNPTLMPGQEAAHDQVLSLEQLRRLYTVATYKDDWGVYGRLLILTGQRHGDVMRFCPSLMSGKNMHLPDSKNGTSHIVPLGDVAFMIVQFEGLDYRELTNAANFKKRWFRKAVIPVTFQLRDIRHSMATHLVLSGENEADVDRLLNHMASGARVYNRALSLSYRREIVARWEAMLFPGV